MASRVLLGAKVSLNYVCWFSVTLSLLLSPTVILRYVLLRGLTSCTVVHCSECEWMCNIDVQCATCSRGVDSLNVKC